MLVKNDIMDFQKKKTMKMKYLFFSLILTKYIEMVKCFWLNIMPYFYFIKYEA